MIHKEHQSTNNPLNMHITLWAITEHITICYAVFACIVDLQTVLITENCGMYTEYAP